MPSLAQQIMNVSFYTWRDRHSLVYGASLNLRALEHVFQDLWSCHDEQVSRHMEFYPASLREKITRIKDFMLRGNVGSN